VAVPRRPDQVAGNADHDRDKDNYHAQQPEAIGPAQRRATLLIQH